MTEYDKEKRKVWQFISDENDIETILNKLDLILEQGKSKPVDVGLDSDTFKIEMGNIQRFNTLNTKLDWIAYRLMRLTITLGEGMNGTEIDEYKKLFTS